MIKKNHSNRNRVQSRSFTKNKIHHKNRPNNTKHKTKTSYRLTDAVGAGHSSASSTHQSRSIVMVVFCLNVYSINCTRCIIVSTISATTFCIALDLFGVTFNLFLFWFWNVSLDTEQSAKYEAIGISYRTSLQILIIRFNFIIIFKI